MAELNLSFLYRFTKGKETKIKRYISMYLQQAPNLLEKMRQQLDDKDYSALAITAHSLKPQAEFMGLLDLKNILMKVEALGKAQAQQEELMALVGKAWQLHQQAVPKLKRKVEELST